MPRRLLLSQELPIELTNRNQGQGHHWGTTDSDRKKFEKKLRSLGLVRTPFDVPVILRVTRLMGPKQRMWDVDSVFRGNWKQIQDSLVACKWFHDDHAKWITDIRQRQLPNGGKPPAILIEVFTSAA